MATSTPLSRQSSMTKWMEFYSKRVKEDVEFIYGGSIEYPEFQNLVDKMSLQLNVAPLDQEIVLMEYEEMECYEDGSLPSEEIDGLLANLFAKMINQKKRRSSHGANRLC
mmetsp:Transcript_13003/g.14302  ORF Transcript_13003/g.14302 Transcript_13003/m.14302 type:complete len:110 (+) Transcript_13003:289-618(+)